MNNNSIISKTVTSEFSVNFESVFANLIEKRHTSLFSGICREIHANLKYAGAQVERDEALLESLLAPTWERVMSCMQCTRLDMLHLAPASVRASDEVVWKRKKYSELSFLTRSLHYRLEALASI